MEEIARQRADLIFYPADDVPSRLIELECAQCLKFLMPYLLGCRESGRIDRAVAEIDFSDNRVVWFGSDEGTIDVHDEHPRFGTARRWLLLYLTPTKRQSQTNATDEVIQQIVRTAYEESAA